MELTKPSQVCNESIFFLDYSTDKHGNMRRKIQKEYPEGKSGPLVIETPFLFSFGVHTGEIDGYTLPVCLWGKDEEPTPEQKEFAECLTFLKELFCEYLERDFESKRMRDILYYKQTTNKHGKNIRDERFPPVLYAKLIYSGRDQKILSLFRTKGDDNVDPMLYFKKYCTVKLALIIESIIIGHQYNTIQVKVSECYVKPQKLKLKPLLTIRDSDSDEETIDDEYYTVH